MHDYCYHYVLLFLQMYTQEGLRIMQSAVADSGGVRGVHLHPPLAASNVFLRT